MVLDIPKKVQYAIARERYLSLENESSVLDEYLSKDVDDDSSLFDDEGELRLPIKHKRI